MSAAEILVLILGPLVVAAVATASRHIAGSVYWSVAAGVLLAATAYFALREGQGTGWSAELAAGAVFFVVPAFVAACICRVAALRDRTFVVFVAAAVGYAVTMFVSLSVAVTSGVLQL